MKKVEKEVGGKSQRGVIRGDQRLLIGPITSQHNITFV